MARTAKPTKKSKRQPRTQHGGEHAPERARRTRARSPGTNTGKSTITTDSHGNTGERESPDRPPQEVHPDDHDYEGT